MSNIFAKLGKGEAKGDYEYKIVEFTNCKSLADSTCFQDAINKKVVGG